ncbi:serine beta-lactamase-like superfamily protein [Sporothrix brasiliensis 5110]|uniref:Serine beta-lactamase-like superfamily protein n=1 Tax=Sporothrix brasiliensis 5110 TaxID=1398154 RepID=A0A0C2EU02_9PEZI|nr:serine beta-lactamase-like superfamily protein [Sporothrix brasiliensis 5110]KIH90014.1 serine beta-lactamase-like superfamily protein [Sporothrix brasiliensis 5110]
MADTKDKTEMTEGIPLRDAGDADTPPTKTETKTSPLNAAFEKLVRDTLDRCHIPGVAVAVVDGDDTWTAGYGMAALPDVPVRPSTLFFAGSTTKSFTAAAASLLVDDDTTEALARVQWTTPLSELIRDDFVLADAYCTAHVTLEDALSHRTGLATHQLTIGRLATASPTTAIRDYVRSLRHCAMTKPIRTAWQYCNGMFIAVGHMMEVVTGQTLGAFMKERLWTPLGMTSTFWTLAEAQAFVAEGSTGGTGGTDGTNGSRARATLAVPYAWDEAAGQHRAVPYFDGVLGGAGAIISTVEDYAAYLRCILRKAAPLSAAGHAALRQPRAFCPPGVQPQLTQPMTYSLGWMLSTYRDDDVMLHPGGVEGMTATMVCVPARDWAVVVFANADSPGREAIAWHLVDERLGVPAAARLDVHKDAQAKRAWREARNAGARARLYPSVPDPPRPLSLPRLHDYAGVYTHPACPDVVVSVDTDKGKDNDKATPRLRADVTGALPVRLLLDHVTADYFVAGMYLFRHATVPDAMVKAEFQLDASGRAKRFGAAVDLFSPTGDLLWFEKQETT